MATNAVPLKSWEHPKKSGVMIREVLNLHAGQAFDGSFLVTVPAKLTGGGRERKQFKTRELAEQWAEDQFKGYRKQGQDFFSLTDAERREVAASMPLLRQARISFADAIAFAVKHLRPEGQGMTVRQIVDELIASKSQRFDRGDLRERSFQDFKHRATAFAEAFESRTAAGITAEEIKGWVGKMGNGVRSNQNYLAVVGEVFKFAGQKRYVAFSPLDNLTDVDRKELCGGHTGGKEPSILTPDDAARLLTAAAANPKLGLLGAVALAIFCGLRTEEIRRLGWDQVRLAEDHPVVTIGAKIAKKRRIRHVEIPAAGVQWLSLVTDRKGPVVQCVDRNDYQRRFRKLLKAAGFKTWGTNSMRHSFGTF
ncbi:MAG TPA: tyrosine-type recombinase/integrase, partial [Opitutaceae bacterium]|nr:tyrosine-type recombinase/integrase [Opitutaceae bacterium]